ncbi:MAG TPA: DUF6600 domain-containing protein [Vicinamibacterales bacterium]|nr:DUF6600 domain-containing protein [Vicinamibacterales bacterium]
MVIRSQATWRLLLVVCACAVAMPAAAQTDEPDTPPPAHVAYIDGEVTIVRDGGANAATINLPIISGDQLRTQQGRAEVIFGDGSVLDLDHFSTVDFLSDDLLRLTEGRLRLTVGGRERVAYRIDTPSASVRIDAPGEYRVALMGESGRPVDVELLAIRGRAVLMNELGETLVRAGERAFATASMAPSYAQAYNSATWDAFDRWAADRRDERMGTTSAQYLPEDVRGYSGAFDRYGDWQYDVTYGYVWYPRVHVGWRPYYHGRWSFYRPWGWTWIAYDPWWGWPTHHYGRWGFSAGIWFWIPSRRWGPAHVYWAYTPGYVGWCPLGWNGRPVLNIVNVNIRTGRHYDPYRAWTVVPRNAFASHVEVGRYAVPRGTVERAVPRWSVASAAAPVGPASIGRSATPIYSAGRPRAVRRGETPAASPAYSASPARGAAASRDYRRARPADDANVPRATPPAARGALSTPTQAERPRARYRDAGPGGLGVRSQTGGLDDSSDTPRAVTPRTYERAAPRGRTDGAYAPRGVPDNAPRGVPNDGASSPRGVPQRTDPDVYRRGAPRDDIPVYRGTPSRRAPEYGAPRGGMTAPPPRSQGGEGRAAPRYGPAPQAAPPRSAAPARPSGPPPSRAGGSSGAPSRGGGSRAVPRGGAPSGSAPSRGGDRARSRRPGG